MSHRAAAVAPPAGGSPPGRAAGTYRRIWDLAWPVSISTSTDTLLGVFFCVAYYASAAQIILAFDREPEVVAAGVPYLKLMALGFLFSAPMFPLVSAMNGAGDTQPPMIAAFVANWLIKLPLCYALAIPLAYGVDGIWVGMFISIVFEAVVMFAWYRRGTWKTKKP